MNIAILMGVEASPHPASGHAAERRDGCYLLVKIFAATLLSITNWLVPELFGDSPAAIWYSKTFRGFSPLISDMT